jgi:UDP-glucose 4-epimerase
MTRFLFTLSDAVDTICAAIGGGRGGETIIPRIPSAKIIDVARAMIGARDIELKVTGIRPGEKLHEILISSEESSRVQELYGYFVVRPMLPEIGGEVAGDSAETWEYSSGEAPLAFDGVRQLLESRGLIGGQAPQFEEELLV